MVHHLQHLEYLTLIGPDGVPVQGADQRWYRRHWQRQAGCGPTTAAVLLTYLAATRRTLTKLVPDPPRTAGDFLPLMEAVWPYVLPGANGLDSPESFLIGCRSFAFSRGVQLTGDILPLPHRTGGQRPSLDWCRDFLLAALAEDRPLAFLNYTSGEVAGLDDWHWVPVTGAEEEKDRLYLQILDGGREMRIDFTLWWNTSLEGGALVSLAPAEDLLPCSAEWEKPEGDILCRLTGSGTPAQVRLSRTQPPEHWLVSWPFPWLETGAYVLSGLSLPPEEEMCRGLLTFAIRTAREQGGRALRLSLPAEESALADLCRALGFRTAKAQTRGASVCYLEKEL